MKLKSLDKRVHYTHLKRAYIQADKVYKFLLKYPYIKVKYTGEETGHGVGFRIEDISFEYLIKGLKKKFNLYITIEDNGKKYKYFISNPDDDNDNGRYAKDLRGVYKFIDKYILWYIEGGE